MVYELPTSAHNEPLPGDELTTLVLNYQWRQIVAIAVLTELRRTLYSEIEAEQDQYTLWINALMTDLYNGEIVDNTPIGMVMAYSAVTPPEKWLGCNGQEVAQATYPDLYALIGDTFGVAAAGNFKLPHINGIQRFVRAFIPPPTVGQEIGDTGGANNMQLTVNHLPLHHHVVPAHSHNVAKAGAVATQNARAAQGNNTALADQATSTQPATDTSDVGLASPDPVQTVPPYILFNYVIKALP